MCRIKGNRRPEISPGLCNSHLIKHKADRVSWLIPTTLLHTLLPFLTDTKLFSEDKTSGCAQLPTSAGCGCWQWTLRVLFSLPHPRPCNVLRVATDSAQGHDLDSADVFPRLRHAPPPETRVPWPHTAHRCCRPLMPCCVQPPGLLTNTAAWSGLYAHCFPDVCHAGDNNHGRMNIGKLRINSRVLFFSCESLVKARNILNKVIMIIHIMFNWSLFFAIYAAEHTYYCCCNVQTPKFMEALFVWA